MNKLLTILQVSGIFTFLLIPALLTKQWWLALVFFIFGMCFGLIEFLSVKFSGLSVSQHFWVLRDNHYGQALFVAISMVIAWGLLITHLMIK